MGEELRTLRARLSLDSGYLTRVMGSLEKQGLVTVRSTKQDGRVRRAHRLTKAGLRERAELDRRSDDLAVHILEILTDKTAQAAHFRNGASGASTPGLDGSL